MDDEKLFEAVLTRSRLRRFVPLLKEADKQILMSRFISNRWGDAAEARSGAGATEELTPRFAPVAPTSPAALRCYRRRMQARKFSGGRRAWRLSVIKILPVGIRVVRPIGEWDVWLCFPEDP